MNFVPDSAYGSELVNFFQKQKEPKPESMVKDLLESRFLISNSESFQFDPKEVYILVHKKDNEALNTGSIALCANNDAKAVTKVIRFD